jgi:hypothetical protein
VLGLPAADEYTAQLRKQRDLAAALAQTSEQVAQRDHWKQQADQAHASLAAFQQRAIVASEVNDYRTSLVQQIRDSGCQLRRLNMGQAVTRPWHNDSHPLEMNPTRGPTTAEQETDFQLQSLTVSLSVSGSLDAVRTLLGKMHQRGTLKHTSQLSIRPTGNDRNEVVMEMDFILYGLEKATKTPVA